MFAKSNKPWDALVVRVVKLFYKMDYRHTIGIRKAYLWLQDICRAMRNISIYGTPDMFHDIIIETTTYCNRRCAYCPNAVSDRGLKCNEQLMPEALFYKIVDDLKKAGFKGRLCPHSYGEPLVDPRIAALMKYAHDKLPCARLAVYTNGDFLDQKIVADLYGAGVTSLYITIHSDEKRAMERIEAIMAYIRSNHFNMRIFAQTINDQTPLSTRAGLVKVKTVKKDEYQCINPVTINYKGDVLICCNDYYGEAVMGNALNENLMDIWKKPQFVALRSDIRRKIFNLPICKKCVKQYE
jgi:MoaA/NifB/PqqE/SkfB family radical SAM enzyme